MSIAGMSILVAEDNLTNQFVATHMLERLGAKVTLAGDGAEALEILQAESHLFDLALIDIYMPRISGLELIRRLRACADPIALTPMIALTAYVMPEHQAEIADAGADGIITKPIMSIDSFEEEILVLLSKARRRRPDASNGLISSQFDEEVGSQGADRRST